MKSVKVSMKPFREGKKVAEERLDVPYKDNFNLHKHYDLRL